jgi:hypothetical protein
MMKAAWLIAFAGILMACASSTQDEVPLENVGAVSSPLVKPPSEGGAGGCGCVKPASGGDGLYCNQSSEDACICEGCDWVCGVE